MNTEQRADAIRSLELFSRLDEAQIRLLAEAASVEEIPKGGLYFSDQAASTGFHMLLSGRVKLYKVSEDGKEQTIFLFGPGEPFCLCSVFSDGKLPGNLAALEPSKVLVVDPEHFKDLAARDPSLLLMVLRVMSLRLKNAMDLIDSLSLKQVPSRLAAYFLTHALDGVVTLGITHREFAKIVGVTPEALSRALKKMVEANLVSLEGEIIRLTDENELRACRDGGCPT